MNEPAHIQMRLGVAEHDGPLLQFKNDEMQNGHFTILVYHYLLGQYRIQLTDLRSPDACCPAGHGRIVQELCTYKHATLARVVTELRQAKDPLGLARSWAQPYNCEFEGGRIKLDNVASDRPELAKAEAAS